MSDITAMFSSLKRATSGARDQLVQLAQREEVLRRERDQLKAQSAAKSDIKRMVQAWLDSMAKDYTESLQANLSEFIRRPHLIPDGAPILTLLSPVGALQPSGAPLTPADMDKVLATLFREPLKAALMKAIDAMQWEEGPTCADRARRLQKLEAEINELNGQQEKLIADAREAGIDLLQR